MLTDSLFYCGPVILIVKLNGGYCERFPTETSASIGHYLLWRLLYIRVFDSDVQSRTVRLEMRR